MNIFLVGMMGTGKSSVGKLLARDLLIDFIDTDNEIESKTGMSIEKIFEERGESYFRMLEKELVQKILLRNKVAVVSSGGGLCIQPGMMKLLKKQGWVVCLWASPECIFARIQHDSTRPLLRVPNPLAEIKEIIQSRKNTYRDADYIIETDNQSPNEISSQIKEEYLKQFGKS
ncbi:MAG: shikimate kinase [Verrucomicrobiota bacterium]|nr:shikimate kinase [Verrucomicrobiota bacterium]